QGEPPGQDALSRLRSALSRRLRLHAITADRAQGAATGYPREPSVRIARSIQRASRDRWPDDARTFLPARARRHHLETQGLALSFRARRVLAEIEMPREPGIRDHRLRAVDCCEQIGRLARARLLRKRQAPICRP